jgi:hypothetical protein
MKFVIRHPVYSDAHFGNYMETDYTHTYKLCVVSFSINNYMSAVETLRSQLINLK